MITPGLKADAVTSICNSLHDQSNADGLPWSRLCLADANGKLLRALSPIGYRNGVDGNAFNGYYEDYVSEVWNRFSSSPLTIDTQGFGTSTCTVSNDQLTCSNDEIPYARPATGDIFGCANGPFANTGSDTHRANVARICAAFVRTTLMLGGGETQPSLPADQYYAVPPTDYYSKFVHENNPTNGPRADGTLTMNPPGLLTVTVGGPQ